MSEVKFQGGVSHLSVPSHVMSQAFFDSHTHPSNTCFSSGDWDCFFSMKKAIIQQVCLPDGTIYTVLMPKEVRAKLNLMAPSKKAKFSRGLRMKASRIVRNALKNGENRKDAWEKGNQWLVEQLGCKMIVQHIEDFRKET